MKELERSLLFRYMITIYVVNLLNCGEDPEEVEAGELLEVLGGPGVGGEEGGEKSRVG